MKYSDFFIELHEQCYLQARDNLKDKQKDIPGTIWELHIQNQALVATITSLIMYLEDKNILKEIPSDSTKKK